MLEHLEPDSSIGFTVEIQSLYNFARKLDATEAARRNEIPVSHGEFVPLLRENERDLLPAVPAVDFEIAVGRENSAVWVNLAHSNQTSISK